MFAWGTPPTPGYFSERAPLPKYWNRPLISTPPKGQFVSFNNDLRFKIYICLSPAPHSNLLLKQLLIQFYSKKYFPHQLLLKDESYDTCTRQTP